MTPTPIRLPLWIRSLPIAVWVTDSDMKLRYVNETAQELLRCSRAALGCSCFEIVSGRSRRGRPFCRPDCPVRAAVRDDRPVRSVDLRVGAKEAETWVRLFVTPLDVRSRTKPLVHMAVELVREQSAERFVARVAKRTHTASPTRLAKLSRREREVLALLAQDKTTRAIADELNISYATVRNHVQHVLAKMDVHSTLEAIACWVLSRTSTESELRVSGHRAKDGRAETQSRRALGAGGGGHT